MAKTKIEKITSIEEEIRRIENRCRQLVQKQKVQAGKSHISQSVYNLKDAANMLNFLQQHRIQNMAGLDEKFRTIDGHSGKAETC